MAIKNVEDLEKNLVFSIKLYYYLVVILVMFITSFVRFKYAYFVIIPSFPTVSSTVI